MSYSDNTSPLYFRIGPLGNNGYLNPELYVDCPVISKTDENGNPVVPYARVLIRNKHPEEVKK